jgi:hypothetical protein
MFARWSLVAVTSTLLFASASPAQNQMGEPFDAASLDNALKGMRVYNARMTDIAAMRVQHLNLQNRRYDAGSKAEKDVNAWQATQSKFRECLHGKLGNDPARMQKMQEKVMALASNPAAMQKYAEAGQAVSAAAAKGDTIAMAKASADMMKALGFDLKADTVAATSACGGAPRRPPAVAEIEQLERQADSLTIRLRRAENAADGDAARAAGVAPSRFAEMRERLFTYAARPSFFQGKEAGLLAARKTEITALTKVQ